MTGDMVGKAKQGTIKMKANYKIFRFIALGSLLLVFGGQEAEARCNNRNEKAQQAGTGTWFGCNCKNGSNPSIDKDNKVGGGRVILTVFPDAERCKTGWNDKFETQKDLICQGFDKANFNAQTMDAEPVHNMNCWKWKCKTVNGKEMAFADNGTRCIEVPTGGEVGADGTIQTPCDEAPMTVTLGDGVSKRVPGNTRVDGVCVPTCQNIAAAGSVMTGDATEFWVKLNF